MLEDSRKQRPGRGKKKRVRLQLDLDLDAEVAGFGSARVPTPAHHVIVQNFASPLLAGPPPDAGLLDLVLHMFTAQEAEIAQHLPPLRPRSARRVAALARRPEREVQATLDHLAGTKAVIAASWATGLYTILPVVPGTFEMALMTPDLATRNAWHRGFAERFERLFETGWLTDYARVNRPLFRALPVDAAAGPTTAGQTAAWPGERLEELLEPYDLFAIGNCQCRLAMHLTGKGCDRPLENCVGYGPMAQVVIERGLMRSASRAAVLEAKLEAEQQGCVTWIGNTRKGWVGNISCSCCGCCCHALRTVQQLNAPALFCAPHFLPQRIEARCKGCGLCADACPLGAWNKVKKGVVRFDAIRCIGCGLCAVACNRGALQMVPVAEAQPPDLNLPALLIKGLPGYLVGSARGWARRLLG